MGVGVHTPVVWTVAIILGLQLIAQAIKGALGLCDHEGVVSGLRT